MIVNLEFVLLMEFLIVVEIESSVVEVVGDGMEVEFLRRDLEDLKDKNI